MFSTRRKKTSLRSLQNREPTDANRVLRFSRRYDCLAAVLRFYRSEKEEEKRRTEMIQKKACAKCAAVPLLSPFPLPAFAPYFEVPFCAPDFTECSAVQHKKRTGGHDSVPSQHPVSFVLNAVLSHTLFSQFYFLLEQFLIADLSPHNRTQHPGNGCTLNGDDTTCPCQRMDTYRHSSVPDRDCRCSGRSDCIRYFDITRSGPWYSDHRGK